MNGCIPNNQAFPVLFRLFVVKRHESVGDIRHKCFFGRGRGGVVAASSSFVVIGEISLRRAEGQFRFKTIQFSEHQDERGIADEEFRSNEGFKQGESFVHAVAVAVAVAVAGGGIMFVENLVVGSYIDSEEDCGGTFVGETVDPGLSVVSCAAHVPELVVVIIEG